MKNLSGITALVTGASGGIGVHIARRLATEGVNVALSGRREQELERLAEELRELGVDTAAVPADLASRAELSSLLKRTEMELGPIDVLVNNAGVENTSAFTSYTEDELVDMIDLNLTAPLLLTHKVLPGMLERGRGHVVFVSSMAGKFGPPYSEPYAASKAGLIGLTQSLRVEYAKHPVGFSVICPGFVAGDGMYQRMVEEGHKSNRLIGETNVEKVADAVVRAIEDDVPEIVESGSPVRPLLALRELSPGVAERLVPMLGVSGIFRRVAASRGRADADRDV
ncbi:MAG: SDR family NAD(P)-dependent oxidoreductase [Solirubrobacteraceae bacterium]